MKSKRVESKYCIVNEEEFSLSGRDLAGFVQGVINKEHHFRLKVRGFSMSPFIKDGDIITISPLFRSGTGTHKDPAAANPVAGDCRKTFYRAIGFGRIVAFIRPETGRVVIHRVVGGKKGSYLIKGDNIVNIDGLIPEENILGCVTSVERNGKQPFSGLGPQRYLIAFLSRWYLLFPLLHFLRGFIRPLIRRSKYKQIGCL